MCRPEPAAVKVKIPPNLFNVENADKEFHTSHSCLQLEMALVEEKKKVKLLLDTSSVSWRKRSHGSSRGSQNWALCVSQMAFHIFSSLLVRSAVFPICKIPQALRANNLVYLLYFPSCFSLILQ